jgi:hypothetical protein
MENGSPLPEKVHDQPFALPPPHADVLKRRDQIVAALRCSV